MYGCRPTAGQDRFAQDGGGIFFGDFLDFHTARRAGHNDGGFDGTIDQDAEVKLALDVQPLFDQQTAHDAAAGAGLGRDQLHAKNF